MHPLEQYLRDLRDIRSTGAGVAETSYYGSLANLLNEVGRKLKPKVRCVIHLADQGAGFPDGGLFTSHQFQRRNDSAPLPGQLPERGAIEIKSQGEPIEVTAGGTQVARYWKKYGLVLVTNYRDFVLAGQGRDGEPVILESYSLASTEREFWELARRPVAAVTTHGERFLEYLRRALLHAAPLSTPKDVAWFLASYARDARVRIEIGELPALAAIRQGLEAALGVTFMGAKGEHFFRSTLVQTLFYGIFSAWVLWHKEKPRRRDRFDWRQAAWSLHVPMIRALFEQVAAPTKLEPLGLVEPLDWAAAVLNRVDRAAFFLRFEEEHAVQYFYEPFLEAFDPDLRKELGVWYTPPEIVRYMVERVDSTLRTELGLIDGLADPNVYVLDPCCGTGAFLVEVLRKVAETLQAKGGDALLATDLRRASRERIFGFEILPAPFVVSHLQLGLLLQRLGAPLSEKRQERAGVFLTNALTGWEPPTEDGKQRLQQLELVFPELAQERDAASEVKRDRPILVILGNPPYYGYAGIAISEERDLIKAYRTTRRAPPPQGQGLNDPYARFFRMAERKIVEGTGKGIVCFISNYGWLDNLSYTGMRELYLEAFDRIWIDNLNGDSRKTGKLTPSGEPDPSIFSTEENRDGIQLGVAVTLLVRKHNHEPSDTVKFRHFWGRRKREQLLEALDEEKFPYQVIRPSLELGLTFFPGTADTGYLAWPRLSELFPISVPGVKTSRDNLLTDIDRDRLEDRIRLYFDPSVSHTEMQQISPGAMQSTARFRATEIREALQRRGPKPGNFVRYHYQPFDLRWLYWEPDTKLLDEKREDLFHYILSENLLLTSRQKRERQREGSPFLIARHLPDWHLTRPGAACFPLQIPESSKREQTDLFAAQTKTTPQRANLSPLAERYLLQLMPSASGLEGAAELFFHALAVGHSPLYLSENESPLWQDWPRIPLPSTRDMLAASAVLGRRVAALLNVEEEPPGVTAGIGPADLRVLGVFSLAPGHRLDEEKDLSVTAGWGHTGRDGITMPGTGRILDRAYLAEEHAALLAADTQAFSLLGHKTLDIFLNEVAFWRNVPEKVWAYTLGGYQVIKKWLSYREFSQLRRSLRPEEIREVTSMVRRIAALLLLQPALDENYNAVKAQTFSKSVKLGVKAEGRPDRRRDQGRRRL
jgi:hypothetical protein